MSVTSALIGAGVSGAQIGVAQNANRTARKFARREALKARQFTERMSSTAYERSMADMRRSGLNPILAYQQGGAQTPGASGANAPQADTSQTSAAGIGAARLATEMGLIKANTAKVNSEKDKVDQNIRIDKPKEELLGTLGSGITSALQPFQEGIASGSYLKRAKDWIQGIDFSKKKYDWGEKPKNRQRSGASGGYGKTKRPVKKKTNTRKRTGGTGSW